MAKKKNPVKDVNEMTVDEFYCVPCGVSDKNLRCNGFVVLPSRESGIEGLHDSGYRCMSFVLITDIGLMRIGGGSDVIHLDGIGGYGKDWLEKYSGVPSMVPPTGWQVDCLAKSGLLRFFPLSERVECGAVFSSFEVWALPREK